MRSRISALWLLTALMLSVVLAACGGTTPTTPAATDATAAPAAQDATTITYFTFSAAPDHLKDLDAMIAAFKAANPNIDVKVETAPYADYFTKLQTLVAGGTAPDVFELNYENFVSYASKGVLADMSQMAAAESGFADKFYPKAYQAFNRDGKQFGLPQSFSDVVLYYNKDLFDAAKVGYPTADWTWKDELVAAQKLTDAGKGVWGDYAPIQFFEFYKTAAQSGCGVFGPDGKTVTINQPGCVESLTWMVDKVNKYKVTPTDADMAGVSDGDLFKQGKIAMLRTGIWMFSAFKDASFKWDIALEPGNTQKAHAFFANSVAISATSKQQEAAWKWANFFTSSSEAAKLRVAASWELPAVSDQSLFNDYLKQTPPESRKVVFDALATAVTPPVTDKQSQLQDMIGALLDQAKAGTITPQEALDQAKTQVEALVK